MIIKHLVILPILLVCLPAYTSASTPPTTLAQVLDAALQADSDYRQARYRRDQIQADKTVARAALLPQLSAQGRISENTLEVSESSSPVFRLGEQTFDTNEYNVTLTQPLYQHKRLMQLAQQRALSRKTDAELNAARQDLITRTVTAYVQLLIAQETRQLAEAAKQATQQQLNTAKARYQNGLASKIDWLEAQAEYDLIEAELIRRNSELESRRADLYDITSQYYVQLKPLDSNHITIDSTQTLNDWINQAQQYNPTLIAARENLQAARKRVSAEWGEHLPSLDLTARYNHLDQDGGHIGGKVQEETTFSVQLNIPLWSSGASHGKVRSARAARHIAQEQFDHTVRQLRKNLRSVWFEQQAGQREQQALNKALHSSQIALDAIREGYQQGSHSALDVLEAQRDQLNAQRNLIEATYQLLLSKLELLQLAGVLNKAQLGKPQ